VEIKIKKMESQIENLTKENIDQINREVEKARINYDIDKHRADYNLDFTMASKEVILSSTVISQSIFNALVRDAAAPESYSSSEFLKRLKSLMIEGGFEYESLTVYMSLVYNTYPVFDSTKDLAVLYSCATAKGETTASSEWLYSAFVTFKK
jgi:hypothetical protein